MYVKTILFRGGNLQEQGILLAGCLTCEGLVGVTHRGLMGEGDYWEWRTPLRFSDVPEVLSVHEIPSEEVRTRLLL